MKKILKEKRKELRDKWHIFNRAGGHGHNLTTGEEYMIEPKKPTKREILEMIDVFSSPDGDYSFLRDIFANDVWRSETTDPDLIKIFFEKMLAEKNEGFHGEHKNNFFGLLSTMAFFAWKYRDSDFIKEEWLKEIYHIIFREKTPFSCSLQMVHRFACESKWNDDPIEFGLKNVFSQHFKPEDEEWFIDYFCRPMLDYMKARVTAKPFASEKEFILWKMSFPEAYTNTNGTEFSLKKIKSDVKKLRKYNADVCDPEKILIVWLQREIRKAILIRDVLETPDLLTIRDERESVCERCIEVNLYIRDLQKQIDKLTGYKFPRRVIFGSRLCGGKRITPILRKCAGYMMYMSLRGE